MLTEDEARRLLQKAGDTIEVSPRSPAGVPRPRRWPALFAAAAVVAVLAGGTWLAQPWAGQRSPDESGTGDELTVADGVPPGTVPSVFGHTRESAAEMLHGLGLEVDVERQVGCWPEGRPVGTAPGTGTPVDRGDTVTLLVSYQGPTTDCAMDLTEPWAFLDFAHGRGPAPAFADEVTLVVDDGAPVTLTSGQAADPAAWGARSALTELREAAAQVARQGEEYATPSLGVQQGTPPAQQCGVRRPASVGDREALTVSVDIPVDGIFHCPATVSLYRTDGHIDTVVTWTEKPIGRAADSQPVPDVEGLPLDDARKAVTDAGYAAKVEELETCDPRPGVVEQAPTPQDVEDDLGGDPGSIDVVTLVVEVPHTTRDCAGLAAAADGFLRFARGGEPPAWAPEVRLLLGFEHQLTITDDQADDPASWALCSGVDPARCPLSAVEVAGDGPVVVAEWLDVGASADVPPTDCLIDLGGLPLDLVEDGSIVLRPREVGACLEWALELWIDGQGRITAVNLRVPRD